MGLNSGILDIGSSKIICLICNVDSKAGILVRGAGICEYPGYKDGRFIDEQAFTNALVDAVNMAEAEAMIHIRDLSVGIPAPFLKLVLHEGKAEPESRNQRVTPETIDDLINDSLSFPKPEGYALMHSTPIEFHVGGAVIPDMPLGRVCDEISAPVSHVFLAEYCKDLVALALDRVDLAPDLYIGVPLSAGNFVIPERERGDCAILIDVGAQHTDLSVLRGGALIACESLPVGGAHFTKDLAFAFSLPLSAAESIKRRYVYSLDYQDSIDTIRIAGGGTLRVEHEAVQYVIEARTKELAELIKQALKEMGIPLSQKLPVYLTGGGISLMRGSCEFLEKEVGLPIKVRMPWMPRLSSPNYSSAFSVMDFVLHAQEEGNMGRLEGGTELTGGFFKKIRGFFTNR
jgi:cell division protein FtsA